MTEYANKVLFLRKSKGGKHLYAFNREGILAPEIESILMNISEVEALLKGNQEWIKVSAMKPKPEGGDE